MQFKVLPPVVGLVRIIHPILGTLPEVGNHSVEKLALCLGAKHMLPQSMLPLWVLFPQSFSTPCAGSNPDTPVEPVESLADRVHGLGFAHLTTETHLGPHLFDQGCGRLDR